MALNINNETFEQLKQAGKPIVIDFWATWCGPCRRVAPLIEQLAEEYADKVNIGKCNVEEGEDIATEFGVTSLPTIVFLDANAQLVSRVVGAQSKATIEEEIKKLL